MAKHSISLYCLSLAVLTVAVFLSAGRNGYVNYDDPAYVVGNPKVQAGLTGENLAWAFTTGHAENWHPMTWISHTVDWSLFGGKPGGAHAVSVAIHAMNAAVLFLLFWRLPPATGAPTPIWATLSLCKRAGRMPCVNTCGPWKLSPMMRNCITLSGIFSFD